MYPKGCVRFSAFEYFQFFVFYPLVRELFNSIQLEYHIQSEVHRAEYNHFLADFFVWSDFVAVGRARNVSQFMVLKIVVCINFSR